MSDRGPLRVGIVGTGHGLRVVAPALSDLGDAAVVGIVGSSPERASTALGRSGSAGLRVFDDVAGLAVESELVVVCSPPTAQIVDAIAALDAGCSVLCEKPFGVDAAASAVGGPALMDSARVAVAYQLRFDPALLALRRVIAAGSGGPLRSVHIHHGTDFLRSPRPPMNWYSRRSAGGGAVRATGVHLIDAAAWLAGTSADVIEWAIGGVEWDPRQRFGAGSDVAELADTEAAIELFGRLQGPNPVEITLSASLGATGPRFVAAAQLGDEWLVVDGPGPPRSATAGRGGQPPDLVALGTGYSPFRAAYVPLLAAAVAWARSGGGDAGELCSGVDAQQVADVADGVIGDIDARRPF